MIGMREQSRTRHAEGVRDQDLGIATRIVLVEHARRGANRITQSLVFVNHGGFAIP
jgi:hypothetical protein